MAKMFRKLGINLPTKPKGGQGSQQYTGRRPGGGIIPSNPIDPGIDREPRRERSGRTGGVRSPLGVRP